MECQSFIIRDNPGERPLQIAAKRYRFQAPRHDSCSCDSCSAPGVIILLLHGVGFNKETWEPFLEEFGDLLEHSGTCGGRVNVKEAWAFDCPNHGEAAVLNDEELFFAPSGRSNDVKLVEYTRSGLRLLKSGLIENLDKSRLILVGHSGGSLAGVWLASMYHKDCNKRFDMCILVEPPGELFSKCPITEQKSESFIAVTKTRKDIWPSKEEAFLWLSVRRPWKKWDKRALEAYVEHGLCSLPTGGYPDLSEGVTLSCHRMHECYGYTIIPELNIVVREFTSVRQLMPVHVIFGERSFLRPTDAIRQELSFTPGMTTHQISNGDHLLPQEMPRELAQSVYDFLGVKLRGNIKRSLL